MDGSPARGQGKAGIAQLNQISDPKIFQSEFERLIRADLQHIEIFVALWDTGLRILHVPAWLRSGLERHPALAVKLQQGEMVGISHEENSAARPAAAARSSVVLIPLINDGRLQAAVGLVSPPDGPHLSAEDIEAVRQNAHDAAPILARLQEIESLQRQNQEFTRKADRAASAEANVAKLADEKNRFEALVKIGWYVQSNIAHDLRTPLGAIRGYARMILDGRTGDINDKQREYLRIITENTNRVISTANWMSHIAELSGQQVGLGVFDLREVWTESARAAQGLLSGKALTLTQRIPEESFEITADPEKLTYVFKELLAVAVKLSPSGSTITVEFSHSRQREVTVKVTARGAGMASETLSGIFDPPPSTTGATQAGKEAQINLSGVYDVIGMYGGRMFVKSAAGQDATFLFTLPAITVGGEDKSHEQTFNFGRR